ncbi:MAG: hypothetical protein ACK5PW_03410 [Burkholderiales bacterium]
MRHRRQAEVAERDALELDVGRVLEHAPLVGAAPRAHRQRRRMFVGGRGQLVERTAGERAEPVQVRAQVLEQRPR